MRKVMSNLFLIGNGGVISHLCCSFFRCSLSLLRCVGLFRLFFLLQAKVQQWEMGVLHDQRGQLLDKLRVVLFSEIGIAKREEAIRRERLMGCDVHLTGFPEKQATL